MSTTLPELQGRVALVTGAGRGIGFAIAHRLAEAGCHIAIQDIDETVAREAAARLAADTGVRTISLGGDATDLDSAPAWIDGTVAGLGGLHILVNNAAIQIAGPWLEEQRADIERQVRADFILPLLLCQRAVPVLRQAGWGRILNVGSIQQQGGNPGMITYAMSKAALGNLTTALGRELAKENITVNQIAPGYIDNTVRNRGSLHDDASRERAQSAIPARRLGQPEDIGGLALLLCSDAGSYITGQSIFVDGGLSAH